MIRFLTPTAKLVVECYKNIEFKTDHFAFGPFIAYDGFLYVKTSSNGWMGFKFISQREAFIHCDYNVLGIDIFYLADIIIRNLAVSTGHAFVHASGFELNGKAYIFPAWGGTGKTNLLLNYLSRGAKYLSDDLLIVSNKGYVLPYPRPLNLLHYNYLTQKEILAPIINSKIKSLTFFHTVISKMIVASRLKITNYFLRKVIQRIELKFHNYVHAEEIFSNEVVCNSKLSVSSVYYLQNILHGDTIIDNISALEISNKMRACHRWERNYYSDIKDLISDFLFTESQIIFDFFKTIEPIYRLRFPKGMNEQKIMDIIDTKRI